MMACHAFHELWRSSLRHAQVEQWAHTSNRMVGDMLRYLALADKHGIKILFSLFNFGIQKDPLKGGKLLTDDVAFASYVSNALGPMVHGVKGSNALLGWGAQPWTRSRARATS